MYLSATAGSNYLGPLIRVPINDENPTIFQTDFGTVNLVTRIKDYKFNGESIPSSYFTQEPHLSDTFSIQFNIKFNQDVAGKDLLWGNDFDEPIRDILPWGASAGLKAFKWAIDPGVTGDIYCDKPYLYGPALSSINCITETDNQEIAPVSEPDAAGRKKRYLSESERSNFVFKKDKCYAFDFFTPYLQMDHDFRVRLPGGFNYKVGVYAKNRALRYVLKSGDKLIFCVVFSVEVEPGDELAEPVEPAAEQNDAGEKEDL